MTDMAIDLDYEESTALRMNTVAIKLVDKLNSPNTDWMTKLGLRNALKDLGSYAQKNCIESTWWIRIEGLMK